MFNRHSRQNLQEVVYPMDGREPYNSFISPMLNRYVKNLEAIRKIIVTREEEHNLQLISYRQYNTVYLWWLIGLYNGITNPITEVIEGKELYIPSYISIENYISSTRATNVSSVYLP